MKDDAEIDELTSYLSYDQNSGVFRWIRKPAPKIRIGDIAGSILRTRDGGQYIAICFRGKRYKAHRLAWLLSYGKWPIDLIDHENCDGSDNRLINLRIASRSQNGQNSRRKKPGLKGAYSNPGCKTYFSTITVFKNKISLGRFSTAEEAHSAYVAAAEKYFGEFARAA